MKSRQFGFRIFILFFLLTGSLAHAAAISGTVTNKTTGKPAAGDVVALVDPQAGMKETSTSTTDARGHFSIPKTSSGPLLVRVTHQGAPYYAAAPENDGMPANITVYDAKAKVNGVSLNSDILQVEAANGQITIAEYFLIQNASSPQVTQFGENAFEFALPDGAVLDGGFATRPNGLPTMAMPHALKTAGHYTFNVPIEPDQGDNLTQFAVSYHLPYNNKITLTPKILQPVVNYAVQLPNSMTFTSGSGSAFQPVKQSTATQSFLLKNVAPDTQVAFTVSGIGSIPRENQNTPGGQQGENGAAAQGNQPGGGIGEPINTPDPLSKYKGWILGGMALLFVVAAALMLRKPAENAQSNTASTASNTPINGNSGLLNSLKEELFKLESEKLSDKISLEEYAEAKSALEAVLKRALKNQ